MKRRNKWTMAIGVFFALAFVVGIVALAAPNLGTESDPLLTKSYVDNVLAANLTDRLEEVVETEATALREELESRIEALEAGGAAGYHVVTLEAGQQLTCQVGTELMLRVGNVHCVASDTPGLIDATGGTTIDNGAALTQNHLYMCTIAGRGIAADEYAMVIVRGSYTIE